MEQKQIDEMEAEAKKALWVQVRSLLSGGGVPEDNPYCDFTLADHHDVLTSRGMTPAGPPDFVPITKKTVTYIVAAVLVNEDNEILMIQEAKPSCEGQWYLPGGRMEPGETIVEAVKREVLEEAGLNMEPTTLLMIESKTGSWYRFVLTGSVIGGRLKTTVGADKGSLQAKWVRNVSEIPLREKDILPLIERGLEYKMNRNEPWPKIMPSVIDRKKSYMRILIACQKRTGKIVVLVGERNHLHLPLCEIHPQKSLHSTLRKYLSEIFGADLPQHRPHGILSMEFNGKPAEQHDGLVLNVLVTMRPPLENIVVIGRYKWEEPEKDEKKKEDKKDEDEKENIGDAIIRRSGKNMTIPLHVIR